MTKPTVAVKRLKRGIPYKAVSALQDFLVSNQLTNTLLLVEHPPTYTVGRRIKEFTHEQKLQTLGAEFIFSKRLKPRTYICALQNMLISTCGRFNVKTETNEHTGIWVKNRKIAALGVQIQRRITSHGFALNCDTDLTWFDHIIPCGLVGYGVTSLTKEVGISEQNVTVTQVIPELIECFEKTFNAEMVDDPLRNQTIDDFINKQLIEHCGDLGK